MSEMLGWQIVVLVAVFLAATAFDKWMAYRYRSKQIWRRGEVSIECDRAEDLIALVELAKKSAEEASGE